MELTRALRDPVGVARGLKHRVGRAVRRLRDRRHLAIPGENEFLGDLGGRYGTLGEFLAAAGRETGRLFAVDIPRPYAAAFFAGQHPARRARIVTAADEACAHRFDLLGSGRVDLGPRLPWHVDFRSGRRWERRAWYADLRSRIETEFGQGVDVKVPWELSRFQHLPALGQAFVLTGERRYYEEFRAQVGDWIGENPPGLGVNWTCTMDVAIRAVNWIWAYGLLRSEVLADRPFASLLLRALFAHGRFIAANLEDGGPARGNHYFADLVGLLFLGVLFRGSPEADVWKGMAISEIVRENERQTYPDGVDYEASTAYHRLMTEMALTALLLAERSGFHLPELRARVRAMLDYVAHYTKPDGLAPQIGDNDDGRLQILGEYDADRRDHRTLLAIGGCAFDDRALFALAGERWEEAFWFFGEACAARLDAPGPDGRVVVSGRVYEKAGVAILRHDDLYVLLDAGPVGLQGLGAHAHNDTLSVEIQAGGEDLVVDPGTGVYTPDLALRDRFRSTEAHNTVRVDGAEINPLPGRPFELPGLDAPSILRFESRSGFDMVEAEHHGYLRLEDPVLHRRIVLLNKRTRRVTIEDYLAGRVRHRLEWSFHLSPRCEVEPLAPDLVVQGRAGEVRLTLRPTLLPEGARGWLINDLFSRGYGRTQPAQTVRYQWEGRLPVTARFSLEIATAGLPRRVTS